jgi:hypothetical protein
LDIPFSTFRGFLLVGRLAFAPLVLLATIVLSLFALTMPDVRADTGGLAVLASGQRDPRGIAISDGYVYWTDWTDPVKGTVSKVSVDGGNVTVLARDTGGGEPLGIAVDGGFVYWTDFTTGTISQVPIAGGPVNVLADNQDHPWRILVQDGYVYWAEFLMGNIKRIRPNGNGTIENVVEGRVGVSGFAINEGYVYWAEGSIQGADVSRIDRASLQGGTPTLFVKTVKPWSITIRGSYLFWTEWRWGGVYKTPLNGGKIEIIKEPSHQNDDFMITSDELNVYWTETASGNIYGVPVAGGAATTLASNRSAPYDIASDGMHLVWTEEKGGNIMLYHLRQSAALSYSQFTVIIVAIVIAVSGLSLISLKRYRQREKGLSRHD